MNISIIDIGTKSLKHYIFSLSEQDDELLNYKRYSEANLGESNDVNVETEARIFSILQKCLDINQFFKVGSLKIVGTEIFRSSKSAQKLAEKIKDMTGSVVEIIDQEKEAFYLYSGFVGLVNDDFDFVAVNIGGGSSEIVLGNKKNLKYSQKLSLGVNQLKNNFGKTEIDWAALDECLDKSIEARGSGASVLFITGVFDFLRLVAPVLGFNFDKCSIPRHPISLKLDEYRKLVMRLRETPVEFLRNIYSKDSDFANNVAIGQSFYLKVAEKLNSKIIIPSDNDLTDGIIREISINI
jgi:exopolyphosphatase / guanosine-5'-triphosphate,3'-diphosphate pyrophosphatase